MGKLFTPQDILSGFQTTDSLNANFSAIETALDACLSRTGDAPNAMAADLDMNSNDILNVGTIDVDNLLVDGGQLASLEDLQDTFAATVAAKDTAVAAEAGAETARDEAVASAASINLPGINPGDTDKFLQVNATEDGYDLVGTVAFNTTTISAGDGLTGGGDLSANRILDLGSPSSITTASTNSVTASSHTHNIDMDGFFTASQSLTSNGYQVLPGGLIIQWGTVSVDYNQTSTPVSFPVSFPTAALNMQAVINHGTSITGVMVPQVHSLSTTGAQILGEFDSDGALGISTYWMAIGY